MCAPYQREAVPIDVLQRSSEFLRQVGPDSLRAEHPAVCRSRQIASGFVHGERIVIALAALEYIYPCCSH